MPAAILLCVAVLSSACTRSSHSGVVGDAAPAPLAAMLAALARSGSARLTGSLDDARGDALASLNGSWSRDLAGAGDVRMKLARPAADPDIEMRWLDRRLFVRRAVGAGATAVLAPLFRGVAERPWRQFQLVGSGAGDALAAAFDPPALVALLQRDGAAMANVGASVVAKAKVTEWSTLRPVLVGLWSNATVKLWIARDDRVVRVAVTSPTGGLRYDVRDFGTAVRVAPPPASEVASDTTVPDHPVGAFVTARSGATNGVTWSLQLAPGSSGTACWRWSAVPALVQRARSDVACLAPADPSSAAEDQVEFLVDGSGAGSYDALAMTLPAGARQVLLGFVGGRTTTVVAASPFVWVGPTSPTIAFARIRLANGSAVDCGAGSISTLDDLRNPDVTAVVAQAPWGCLPAP